MIFKEKITSRRPELAARLTALAAKRMPLSLATAKPQPGAFHPVHEVFVLGLSVHLPPREDTVPRAASCRLPAACQPRLLQHDHQPGPLLPPHLHSGQVQLPSLHLLDLSLLAVQPQLEVLAVVMVAEVLPQEPLYPLQLLALALLEDGQDPLPPLLCQGEVPPRQLHHQQVLLAQWGTVAPVSLPGLPVHLVTRSWSLGPL